MDTSIISKVSELILEKRMGYKLTDRFSGSTNSGDTIQISSVANEAVNISKEINNGDQERTAKVQELRERVHSKSFTLNDEMVETIAENIAKMFV
jgi:hypothetical protein